jgi:hypothetical protein
MCICKSIKMIGGYRQIPKYVFRMGILHKVTLFMVRFSCDTSCVSNGQSVFLKDIMSTNVPYSSISVASVINVTILLYCN